MKYNFFRLGTLFKGSGDENDDGVWEKKNQGFKFLLAPRSTMREKTWVCIQVWIVYYLNLESTNRHPILKFSVIDLRSGIFIFLNQFFLGINVFVLYKGGRVIMENIDHCFLKWENFLKFGLLDFENLKIIWNIFFFILNKLIPSLS